jgi:hypothetical protein
MTRPGNAIFALLLSALLALASPAQGEVPVAYQEGPYYDELMGAVMRLRIIGSIPSDTACTRGIADPKPCADLKAALEQIIEENDLPATPKTIAMLQAYAEGEWLKADRLYASVKGYELPDHLKERTSDSLAREVAAFGVRAEVRDDTSCKNDVFAPKPCPEAVRAFKQFARENGLPETRSTAEMFYAYVEGDKETGDELYAFLSGKNANQPRNELLAEVRSYRVPAEEKKDTSCENNYFAAKPCMAAVSAWRDFSRKHGLELTRQTADLFQAYVAGDEVTGDKLYAAAKGITVAELLQDRGVIVDETSGQPLYVPIYPAN